MCENRGCSTKEGAMYFEAAPFSESPDSFSVLPPSAHMGLLIWFPTMTCDWLPNWTEPHYCPVSQTAPTESENGGLLQSDGCLTSGQSLPLGWPNWGQVHADTVLSVWFLLKLIGVHFYSLQQRALTGWCRSAKLTDVFHWLEKWLVLIWIHLLVFLKTFFTAFHSASIQSSF